MNVEAFVRELPKAELHLHIEGTLEPEMVFALASRNGLVLPYSSVAALRAAYCFVDLQSFLDVYYACAQVLQTDDPLVQVVPPRRGEPLPIPTGWRATVRQAVEGIFDAS